MKDQQGAALVVVMAFLSGALMLGMSGMQSALIDERLAGNYRASTQAQMTSDNILAALASDENKINRENSLTMLMENGGETLDMDELIKEGTLRQFLNGLLPINYDDLEEDEKKEEVNKLLADLELKFEINEQDQTIKITATDLGLRNNAFRDSTIVYSYNFSNDGVAGNYVRGIVGCEGIIINNSTKINSFSSLSGNGFEQGLGNASLVTREPNGNILFDNNARIYGDVKSSGDIRFTSSTEIIGDVYANGWVDFGNWGAYVDGNAIVETATGSRNDASDHVSGDLILQSGGAGVDVIDNNKDCDVQDVNGLYNDYLSKSGLSSSGSVTISDWEIKEPAILSADGFYDPHPNHSGSYLEVENLDGESIVVIDSFKLSGSRSFQVGTSSSPVNMVMLVERDFEISGNTTFVIEEGSSLTVIIKGRFDLIQSNDIEIRQGGLGAVGEKGVFKPAFKVISLYSDVTQGDNIGAGIRIAGASNYLGEIMAPFSNVNILGSSNLYGAVYSRSFFVGTSGSVYYDEAFGVPGAGSGGGTWCSFSNLSPLTVIHPLESFSPPSSNAAFNGLNIVPDMAVANGDGDKADDAEKTTDTTREGVLGGVFDDGIDATKFDKFVDELRLIAKNENTYVNGDHEVKNKSYGGKERPFGEIGQEEVWFIDGNVSGNNLEGAGVLVVNGDYDIKGNPEFNGLLIVLGNYYQGGGGGRDFKGALLVAPYDQDLNFTAAKVEFSGGGNNDFIHDGDALSNAFSLLEDEAEAAWNYCNAPTAPGNGELQWELIDWR